MTLESEINELAKSIKKLEETLTAVVNYIPTIGTLPVVEEPEKKTRAKKEKTAEPVVTPTPADEPEAQLEPDTTLGMNFLDAEAVEAEKPVTAQDIIEVGKQIAVKAGAKAEAVYAELFNALGSASLKALPQEKYAEALKLFKAKLGSL